MELDAYTIIYCLCIIATILIMELLIFLKISLCVYTYNRMFRTNSANPIWVTEPSDDEAAENPPALPDQWNDNKHWQNNYTYAGTSSGYNNNLWQTEDWKDTKEAAASKNKDWQTEKWKDTNEAAASKNKDWRTEDWKETAANKKEI